MGTYLGTQKKDTFRQSELGDQKWYEKAIDVAPGVYDFTTGIFGGGGGCSSADKQRRQQIATDIATYLTESDRRELVAGTESNVAPTPTDMAYFLVGGDDCKHKNVSPGDQRFRDRYVQLIQQRKQQSGGKNLPANITLSSGQVPAVIKYGLIGMGLIGAAAAGYYSYKKLKK